MNAQNQPSKPDAASILTLIGSRIEINGTEARASSKAQQAEVVGLGAVIYFAIFVGSSVAGIAWPIAFIGSLASLVGVFRLGFRAAALRGEASDLTHSAKQMRLKQSD